MITKVRLRNWKSHLDSRFNFCRGVNALIGIMGSGKSSVMDGIAFALFGNFPNLQSKKIVIDDLIMRRPQEMNAASVEMEFENNGRIYSVKRIIERGKRTVHAELRENGILREVNPRGVSEEIERILQMDYDLFSRAVYSEQNALDYFLRIPKGQRMDQIDRMLKLDLYGKARESVVQIRNRILSRLEEKMKLLNEMEKEKVTEGIDSLRGDINRLEEKQRDFQEKTVSLRNDKSRLSSELEEYEQTDFEYKEIEKFLEGSRGMIAQVEKNIESKEKILEKLPLEKEFQQRISIIKKDFESGKSSLEILKKEKYGLEAKRLLLFDGIRDISKLEDRCPVCESEISQGKKSELISHRETEIEKIEKELAEIASQIFLLEKGIGEKDDSISRLSIELDRRKSLEKEIEYLKREKEIISLKEKSYKEKEKRLSEILEKVDLKRLRKDLQEIVARETEFSSRLSGIEEIISEKKNQLKILAKRNEIISKYRKETEKDEKSAKMLEDFSRVLRITQDELRQEFLKVVNSVMTEVWDELYPYSDFEDIRLVIENDYVLQLKDRLGWVSVDGIVSGGERSLACLALRIAFSLAFIPNLKWLILDEPTHNLDANSIQHFANIMREKMQKFADQVFLITHEERLSDGITGSLYRLERNKAENEPTRVMEI